MTPEHILRDKLRKIEALFAGGATDGEKAAAGAAAQRIRDRLGQATSTEKPAEVRFSIPDAWSRHLFIALCRRYASPQLHHVMGDDLGGTAQGQNLAALRAYDSGGQRL